MSSFRIFDRRVGIVAAAFALLLSAVVPVFASAAQITERSVALSSSIKSATGVEYAFTFTATDGAAGAVVVQFCDNTPLIGEFCDAPAGMNAAAATAVSGATIDSASANQVVVTKDLAAGANTFTLGTITNPNTAGALYARVLTYADATAAANYVVDESSSALGSPADQGSIALSITEGVNVSAAVLESMTFCVVGGQAPGASCDLTGTTAPTLELGEDTGETIALSSSALSTGTIYTQISTNAAGGAIVSLKNNAACGGLKRAAPVTDCDIAPAGTTGTAAANEAEFGVRLAAAAGTGVAPFSGAYNVATASSAIYDDTNYRMNWVSGNATGVSSTYGDPILDTDGAPVSNMGLGLVFGASITNNTPAGKYAAELSLIATGTF